MRIGSRRDVEESEFTITKGCFMRSIFSGLVGLSLFVSSAAQASPIAISGSTADGLEGLGSFTGSLDYNSANSVFSITLTNTSASAGGGYITGFAFNIAGNSTANLTSGGSFTGISNVSASPFGTFEEGAALGANWLGGGSPKNGIGVGQTATFVFQILGLDPSLTTESFLSTSTLSGDNTFAVRFRGFGNGGSDKIALDWSPPVDGVPGDLPPVLSQPPTDGGIPDGGGSPVPLPAAVWAGLAMAGAMGGWRKTRRNA
jgi:hypothetical protein